MGKSLQQSSAFDHSATSPKSLYSTTYGFCLIPLLPNVTTCVTILLNQVTLFERNHDP